MTELYDLERKVSHLRAELRRERAKHVPKRVEPREPRGLPRRALLMEVGPYWAVDVESYEDSFRLHVVYVYRNGDRVEEARVLFKTLKAVLVDRELGLSSDLGTVERCIVDQLGPSLLMVRHLRWASWRWLNRALVA